MRERINALARALPTWPVYLAGSLPCATLLILALTSRLGPDPAKALELDLGLWALRFLIAALCVSPLNRAGLRLIKFRRALGILAFTYATLHFLTWLALDMGLRWEEIGQELARRPYILIGLAALLMMAPLALTSWNGAIRRMGAAKWKQLHRLAYPALLAAALHFAMIGKVWTAESVIYLGLALMLLVLRLPQSSTSRSQQS